RLRWCAIGTADHQALPCSPANHRLPPVRPGRIAGTMRLTGRLGHVRQVPCDAVPYDGTYSERHPTAMQCKRVATHGGLHGAGDRRRLLFANFGWGIDIARGARLSARASSSGRSVVPGLARYHATLGGTT